MFVCLFVCFPLPFLDWILKPVKYFLRLCHGGILDADTRQFFCPFLSGPCNGKLMSVLLKGWCSFVLMQPSNPLSQCKSHKNSHHTLRHVIAFKFKAPEKAIWGISSFYKWCFKINETTDTTVYLSHPEIWHSFLSEVMVFTGYTFAII